MKEFADGAKVSSEYDTVLSRIQHDMKRTSRQANVTTSRFQHIAVVSTIIGNLSKVLKLDSMLAEQSQTIRFGTGAAAVDSMEKRA
jgi:hypothetical protein